ncbi:MULTISPECIES: MucR family transcriptional regulator [unclassified Bosea (in: a-proteobacteria)]|uniref:MucR family transcriptional regulator n=1 Tax=unclassified Bosea (in: a-proteobacteria) TaxID=2653178 RepID=UPI000F76194D|nr:MULTISPECIES: MucR family transcriptional regulator [unclassified Bosea (in: a-proteobacteria)]AZO81885.1 MucR family transcriptional regulator [Bosea sp. Tri-49]RXT16801.1 MucR family transcriptional regulator [Bosea sp. Tri-39]RXT37706.1 MucR family transcriptional regulator [Bosea sp. Tri-54]
MSKDSTELLELSAMVVAAFVRHNRLPQADLAGLIEQAYAALGRLGQEPAAPPTEKPVPAVPIKKSVTPDAIYSLEDGKPFKSLKRHLRSAYDMSPEDYRAKWDLPADYPMVAPNYAEARSQMAKSLGLGRKKGQSAPKRRNQRK